MKPNVIHNALLWPSTTARQLSGQLLSFAGLVGRPICNQTGLEIGHVRDVVVRWDDDAYPAVTGLIARVGRREAFLPVHQVATLTAAGVSLRSAKFDLRDYTRRDGEIALGRDVLDHQLIDLDGARVVRASDLYLASLAGSHRLVGADVGLSSLVRRLGPARFRQRPTPSRVIDWAAIQPITNPGEPVRIARTRDALHRLRPAELASLLEDLSSTHRQGLVNALDPGIAADALEEMATEPLDELLADLPPERAAALINAMAPDEAAEALREMNDDDRKDMIARLPSATRNGLANLLIYDSGTAGAVMTTTMVILNETSTIADTIDVLGRTDNAEELDGVLIVDQDGRLIDDVTLLEIVLADRSQPIATLINSPYPVTVAATDDLAEVVERFIRSRHTSLVVIDSEQRPIGRILADDIIDALVADRRLARRNQ